MLIEVAVGRAHVPEMSFGGSVGFGRVVKLEVSWLLKPIEYARRSRQNFGQNLGAGDFTS